MASETNPALTPLDQASIAEAHALARRAAAAQRILAELSQAQIDGVVDAMAAAALAEAEPLAQLAWEETGYGVVADKREKNLFAARDVHAFIRPMKTVGVVARHDDRRVVDIAEPFGVVAAIVPSTNPTSTAIYKLLISLKARCAVVISPHPSAARCITRTAELMTDAGRRAGLPDGAIGWMSSVSLPGTQALMRAREVAVILATGGLGLVRAAYSAGKPAYGVGPGNAPCYVDASADIAKAASDILAGKSFDHGVLCSSPNSVVVDVAVAPALKAAFQAGGGFFLTAADTERLAKVLILPTRLPNPALVGKSAVHIAAQVGIAVPAGTRALIAPLAGVGRDHPLSIEKLCPVLSYYEVADWREGCERATQILRYGGMGHTMSIHARNEADHPGVRLAQAGLPHLREHADDLRIDWADDRARPGDDARLRGLRRQHHFGQHHAAPPVEHQTPGLRTAATRHPCGRGAGPRPGTRPAAVAAAPGARRGARPRGVGQHRPFPRCARRSGTTADRRRAAWSAGSLRLRGRRARGRARRYTHPGGPAHDSDAVGAGSGRGRRRARVAVWQRAVTHTCA